MSAYEHLGYLFAIGSSYAALAVLPGPNFVVVSRLGLTASRVHACLAALGVASGAAALAVLALSGSEQIAQWPAGRGAALLGFAGLLLWLGAGALLRLRRAIRTQAIPLVGTAMSSLRLGFLTAVSNPFTAAFFLGLGSGGLCGPVACLPLPVALTVFVVALLWFGAVAFAFSRGRSGRAGLYLGRWAEGLAGLVLVGLGLRMIWLALG